MGERGLQGVVYPTFTAQAASLQKETPMYPLHPEQFLMLHNAERDRVSTRMPGPPGDNADEPDIWGSGKGSSCLTEREEATGQPEPQSQGHPRSRGRMA